MKLQKLIEEKYNDDPQLRKVVSLRNMGYLTDKQALRAYRGDNKKGFTCAKRSHEQTTETR